MGLLYTIKYDFDSEIKPNKFLKRIKMGEEYYLVEIHLSENPTASIKKIVVMNFPNTTTSVSTIKYVTIENDRMDVEKRLDVITYGVPTMGQTKHIIALTNNTALCKDKKAVSQFVKYSASILITNFHTLGDLINKKDRWKLQAFSLYKQAMTLVKKL